MTNQKWAGKGKRDFIYKKWFGKQKCDQLQWKKWFYLKEMIWQI